MCPVTGQPDFAEIQVKYVPDDLCIELKSLECYLASYRNSRAFNEEVVNRILDDIVKACRPRHAVVHGEFASRGGISVIVDSEDAGWLGATSSPKLKAKSSTRRRSKS